MGAAIGAATAWRSAGVALVTLLSVPDQPPPLTALASDDDDILIFGQGGAFWSNGSRALATDGLVSWACALLGQTWPHTQWRPL